MSTFWRRHSKKKGKGNPRRKQRVGILLVWTAGKYVAGSFSRRGVIEIGASPCRLWDPQLFLFSMQPLCEERVKMKKTLWVTACALTLLAGCSSSGDTSTSNSSSEANQETFTVGMECNYAPFNWQTTNSTDTSVALPSGAGYCDGYDVMISQTIADKLDKKLVVKKIVWDGLQPALESGEIDAVIAGMTANEEREEGMDFTTPYYESDMVLIVPANSEVAQYTSIQDFSGHKVIGQKNTNYDTIIDQIEGVDHVTPKAAYPELILALQTGEAEAITAELPVAQGIVEANPDLTYIVFEEGKGFEVDTSVSIGLKNNTRDTEEFQNIQKALDEISQDQRDEMMVSAVNNAPTGD